MNLNPSQKRLVGSIACYLENFGFSESFEKLVSEAGMEVRKLKSSSFPCLKDAHASYPEEIELHSWILEYLKRFSFTETCNILISEANLQEHTSTQNTLEALDKLWKDFDDFLDFLDFLNGLFKKKTNKKRKISVEDEEENEDTISSKQNVEMTLAFKGMLDAAAEVHCLVPPVVTPEAALSDFKYIESEESDFEGILKSKEVNVSNLPKETTKADVVDFFKNIGNVSHVRLIKKATKETADAKTAIVRFKYEKLAKQALKMNGEIIHVTKKDGNVLEQNVYMTRVIDLQPIFISGFDTTMSRKEIKKLLRKIFSSYGSIKHIFLSENRSFAYLLARLRASKAYEKAITSGFFDWKGSKMTVRETEMKGEYMREKWASFEKKKKKKKSGTVTRKA